jgi:hypothetical protein
VGFSNRSHFIDYFVTQHFLLLTVLRACK